MEEFIALRRHTPNHVRTHRGVGSNVQLGGGHYIIRAPFSLKKGISQNLRFDIVCKTYLVYLGHTAVMKDFNDHHGHLSKHIYVCYTG